MGQMTMGEMNAWTKRLNQIIGASQTLKDKRLNNMLNDLVLAHDENDPYAAKMYLAVCDEIEG